MSDSLKNQLLGLGFKPAAVPERKVEARKPPSELRGPKPDVPQKNSRPQHDRQGLRRPSQPIQTREKTPRSEPSFDLGKAYAIRAQQEKDERIETERLKQEEARLRREAKAKLTEFIKGKALNAADADIARHFPYGGKIKRIHVTAEQLKALNTGALGVLQEGGRYLLVDAAVLAEAEQIFPAAIALKVDPDAPAENDLYSDSQFQVPDDLVW